MIDTTSRNGIRYPPEFQEALGWLGARPADDALRDLAPLRRHLAAIALIGIPPLQHLKILELFQARIALVAETIKPLLYDATLPLPKRLRTVAQGLMNVHGALAAGYLKMLHDILPTELTALKRTPTHLCERGLANLAQQYEVAQLVSAPAPQDFWAKAQTFYRLIDTAPIPDSGGSTEAGAATQWMKAMLALAAAQPEGFSPREAAFLAAYLHAQAAAVDIHAAGKAQADDDYWLDAAHGFPPTATIRRQPPYDDALRYSCVALSQLARLHLEQLDSPEAHGLPGDAICADYRDVLARAAQLWASPPSRQTRRRRQGYRVQVCPRLAQLWQQDGDNHSAEVELPASDWLVLNESPSGYAIMHVAGELAGLVSGSAIGLRPAADKPWNICVVRWARSENPEHIELGLEIVAPLAAAVRIARNGPGGEPNSEPVPALLLPPLPALQRGEALLTARGGFAPGAFTLIDESSGRISIVECAAAHLSMHTACIEIFEFERKF